MNVELICVGSELLAGDVVNTNAAYISKKLLELGHDTFRQFTVDDNKYRLSELVIGALKRCDILIVTGGLGPTADDLTKETVCESLGLALEENGFCKNHIDGFFAKLGKVPTENNFKQALAPKGAIIFPNDIGTACGMCIEDSGKRIILLPGPPKELTRMFDTHVMPYLKGLSHGAIVSHRLNVFGIGESSIEAIIKPLCLKENPIVATYCGDNECSVKVTATAATEAEAEAICSKTLIRLRELLGDFVYGSDSDGLAHEVVGALRSKGLKVSTAESCTGGMLSQALTSVPRASEVVEIGILAYSNRIKQEALSVPTEIIEKFGAISTETAMHLAKNVRALSNSDIGVSITGNAGPSASEDKPVGLVYVCIADRNKYFVKKLRLSPEYDRDRIRRYATLTALDLIRRYTANSPYGVEGMVGFNTPFVFDSDNNNGSDAFSAYLPLKKKPEQSLNQSFDPNMNFIIFDNEENEEPDENTETFFKDYFEQHLIIEDGEDENVEEINPETLLEDYFSQHLIIEDSGDENVEEESPAVNRDEKKNRFLSLLARFVPTKKDKALDVVIKIVSIIAIIGLITSSSVLVYHFAEGNKQMSIIEEARDGFDFANVEKNGETDRFISFDTLYAQNSDIRAWIEIPGNAKINNPVYQSSDNDYYLTHNMLKKKSRYGALFFDEKNVITAEANSKNLTIYGHNMKDKSMFASLLDYKSLKYFKQHPIINMKTLYNQNEYVIFSIMITAGSSADDNGNLYKFYRSNFDSNEDFMNWIAESKSRSIINTSVEVDADDEILTLATCCYDFENARFVVMAKKLNDGEPRPNISGAINNPNVRYPQAWYDKNGLKGYDPNADTSSNETPSSSEDTTSDPSSDEISSEDTSSDTTSSQVPPASDCNHEIGADGISIMDKEHRYICTKCEGIVTEKHSFTVMKEDDKYKKNGTPNCTTAATYYYSCACGKADTAKTFTVGKPNGHSFGAWNTTKPATDTTPGLEERICNTCKHKETQEIPATNPTSPPNTDTDPNPDQSDETQPTT